MTSQPATDPMHGALPAEEAAAIDRYTERYFGGPVSSGGFPADTDLDEPDELIVGATAPSPVTAPSPDMHQGARAGVSADESEDAMHDLYMRTHWG